MEIFIWLYFPHSIFYFEIYDTFDFQGKLKLKLVSTK